MIIAKLGMSLLGAAMKKGAGTAVTSGLASSLGKSALGALTGSTGGKGGGMGGGKGGGRGGMGGGQGGGASRGGKGGQGGQAGKSGQSKGQGGQSRSSQNQQDDFSLEDALNMLLEQNKLKNQEQQAPKQSANLRKLAQTAQNQDEAPCETTIEEQAKLTAPSLTEDEQVQVYQEAIAVLQGHIVSFSAGRVRIRHPQLQQSQDHAALEQALLQEGLSSVSFKASTGSALITYDAKSMSQEAFLVATLPLAIYIVCGRIL